ncbi:hypothetical protein D1872_188930 [compost metagenome]
MTVALYPFPPSVYATYGVPSGAIASEVSIATPAEKPTDPTGFQDELAYTTFVDEPHTNVEKTRRKERNDA